MSETYIKRVRELLIAAYDLGVKDWGKIQPTEREKRLGIVPKSPMTGRKLTATLGNPVIAQGTQPHLLSAYNAGYFAGEIEEKYPARKSQK